MERPLADQPTALFPAEKGRSVLGVRLLLGQRQLQAEADGEEGRRSTWNVLVIHRFSPFGGCEGAGKCALLGGIGAIVENLKQPRSCLRGKSKGRLGINRYKPTDEISQQCVRAPPGLPRRHA